MGIQEIELNRRVTAWLAHGGLVLAASERAARAVTAAHDAAQRAQGRQAWPTAAVYAWDSWVRERWLAGNADGLVLLNPLQEQALWGRVIRGSRAGRELLHVDRLAAAAMRAYGLVCRFAPDALRPGARTGWGEDAAVLSDWLAEFELRCRRDGLIGGSRLELDLAEELGKVERVRRQPLLLIGFDRLLETQTAVLNAWGEWQVDETDSTELAGARSSARFVSAADGAAEVAACVRWLRAKIAENPDARLMVVTTGLESRRGELERALLEVPAIGDAPIDFEFSLGVPLGQVGLVRGAMLLLRWMAEAISESELDWLLTSGYCAASEEEEIALAGAMLQLRNKGLERPTWTLEDFAEGIVDLALPAEWIAKVGAARGRLPSAAKRLSPLEWAKVAAEVLEAAGWAGFRPFASVTYQAQERWERVLEDCGSLGFDGSQVDWGEFVRSVGGAVEGTIFAAESWDASVMITEPVASAGQLADGIWFLGADEQSWPGRGQPHPLLPIGLQREAGMPHASAMADWELARAATERLLESAEEVVFSFARMGGEGETRPSRLVAGLVGQPRELEVVEIARLEPTLEIFEDWSRIPFPLLRVSGGAGILTRQSLCPFQAFATARLGTTDWEAAETGLNAKQRGQLLHAVLHRAWGGRAKDGITTLAELRAVPDLAEFVGRIAGVVVRERFTPGTRGALPARFPQRYLELEQERLTRLVAEWLAYERERLQFSVQGTEVDREVTVAGLTLRVRLDRVDELEDDSQLVIDYKSSVVGPQAWAGSRPDDVQLPLYAACAVDSELEGLVFARVRPGDVRFLGRVRNAGASLLAGLTSRNGLVGDPLTVEQLAEWRETIVRLGADFLAGRADVDPKDAVKVCANCGLQAICRISENRQPGDEDEEAGEGGDE